MCKERCLLCSRSWSACPESLAVDMQTRAQLPITLVLGMSISVAALRHMLPVKAADVLQAKEFRLVQVWLTSRKPCNHGYL